MQSVSLPVCRCHDHVGVFVSEYSDLFFLINVARLLQLMRFWLLFFRAKRESLRSFDWPRFNDRFSVHLQVLDLLEQLVEGHQTLLSKCQ